MRYWSNSKIADWVRGIPKGGAKTGPDWHKWEKEAKATHPIRYWIVEEGFDKVQTFIRLPVDTLYNAKYYINNRFVTRTHSLTAHSRDIRPGDWCDVGNRFLPCLFNELVDFVEIEQAWFHIAWDDEAKAKYDAPFWARGWFRWRTWRCPQAGLDHLDWAIALDEEEGAPTRQSIAAKEIKELYLWWTQTYRNRPDPMEASGWSAYCAKRREKEGGIFGSEDETEEEQQAEDEAMMIRLIKIRQALWT